jgi:hypothetical protein
MATIALVVLPRTIDGKLWTTVFAVVVLLPGQVARS